MQFRTRTGRRLEATQQTSEDIQERNLKRPRKIASLLIATRQHQGGAEGVLGRRKSPMKPSEPSHRPDRPCLCSMPGGRVSKATCAGGVFPSTRCADPVRAMPSDLHFAPLNVQGLDSVSPSGRTASRGMHILPVRGAATLPARDHCVEANSRSTGRMGRRHPPDRYEGFLDRTSDLMPTAHSIDTLCSARGGLSGHAGSPALKPGQWVPTGRQWWSP